MSTNDASMELLRKFIAITLLAFFGVPVASSLFALMPKTEANLPACCRRNGQHHCVVSMAKGSGFSSDKPAFASPPERCPFAPSHLVIVPSQDFIGVLPGSAFFAGLVSHPAVYAQTLAKWRINRERSNQKRGPPTA
jgi:hypothetical protein